MRSITVFITGEAEAPGSYTVSSLSTITNALFASGGIRETGSLRNVQLKRRGRLVSRCSTSTTCCCAATPQRPAADSPSDVIFIPPVGTTAGITGEVRRPAIYELKGEQSASELCTSPAGCCPTQTRVPRRSSAS